MTERPAPSLERETSVANSIAEALASRIVGGSLAPGARLLQDQIAAEFGVSHVPVREAFRLLDARGLVVTRPRRGVLVAPLDPAAVLEATEIRAALESLALRFAIPNLTKQRLDEARRAIEEGESHTEIEAWDRANRRFHLAITAPCGMPRLMSQIGDLHQSTARFLFATWKELDWQPRSDADHRAIVNALAKRKGDRAIELLEAHVRDAGHALSKLLNDSRDSGVSAA